MAKTKTLTEKLQETSVKLYDLEFHVTTENLREDGTLPDAKEVLVKEIHSTRKHIEQLVYLLNKQDIK